jgi:L-asparaginase
MRRPRIAVFSGPTATIQNAPPLRTSAKARTKYGLPIRAGKFDVLRPQRLAAPVTVYIEQFTAHPLEVDRSELYAPPDGYVDATGTFSTERKRPTDIAVYEVTLRPEDGLYLLPYMARQAGGEPWEDDAATDSSDPQRSRQTFYPDASRVFEEIDRFGIGMAGEANLLADKADFDHYRAAPPAGYTRGVPAKSRTDRGEGDVSQEVLGVDFFPYRPASLRREPGRDTLVRITNMVQRVLATTHYDGAIWLEGSPFLEETAYWLNLIIDTTTPVVGTASHRPHGAVGGDGDRNIIDCVDYILSRVWADPMGRDLVGVVVVEGERIFSAREVQKADARPGGFIATGGHGGVVGSIGDPGAPTLTFRPVRHHTYDSEVNLARMPKVINGIGLTERGVRQVDVQIRSPSGELIEGAIPTVKIVKHARYLPAKSSEETGIDQGILRQIRTDLAESPLVGLVFEGATPYGHVQASVERAIRIAAFMGIPTVKVGRGNADGFTPNWSRNSIAGSNLTATKARLLLTACLMRFGALPPAMDPDNPTAEEQVRLEAKLVEYQRIFDTH